MTKRWRMRTGGDIIIQTRLIHMAITEFTEEQIQILSKNPYTLNVTTKIMFTKEAKEKMRAARSIIEIVILRILRILSFLFISPPP